MQEMPETPPEIAPAESAPQRQKPTASRRSEKSAPSKGRGSLPPYNPGLQHLVEAKQAWAGPPDPSARTQGFIGWHQRGYLPHRDNPGLTQFVTFRLRDGLPANRRGEWEALLHIEDNRRRRILLENYLDRGYGQCWLRQPSIATVAEAALRHFDSERYQLLSWVIMPNHIHVLVQVWLTPLSMVVQSWKRFIARETNRLLHREGSFWQREYWDTYMRDEAQAIRAQHYIEQNPVKARLANEAKDWPWSSARLRDLYGQLQRSS